jgi:2-isopropylmalate synthase
VPERSPWAGDLVFTAFSGSHQDAFKKGFEAMAAKAEAQGVTVDEIEWAVPYLPVDPKDLGRSYEAVIRVNSQSGKGGVAYLLKADHALDLPRKLQIEFSGVVQAKTDAEGGEVTSDQIWAIFNDEYLPADADEAKWGRFELLGTQTRSDMTGEVSLDVVLRDGEDRVATAGTGNGPIAAFIEILRERGFAVSLYDYVEHTMSSGGDAQAAAYVELQVDDHRLWGVGIDGDISTASLKAIVSCVNRSIRSREPELVEA